MPFRSVFDLLWSGRRHVIMTASQIDRYGNHNFACIGDFAKPKSQLLGMRGAPGNTISHPTSYWVPPHSTRVFVETGRRRLGRRIRPGRRAGRERALPRDPPRRLEPRRLRLRDARTSGMRLRTVHPGVEVDQVVEATSFELALDPTPEETRLPTDDELRIMREVLDPREPPRARSARLLIRGPRIVPPPPPHPALRPARHAHPIVQTGMGWVATPELVAAASERGRIRFPGGRDDPPERGGRGDPAGAGAHRAAVRRELPDGCSGRRRDHRRDHRRAACARRATTAPPTRS